MRTAALFALFVSLLAGHAHAGGSIADARIVNVSTGTDGLAYIQLNKKVTNSPACSGYANQLAYPTDSVEGQMIHAIAMGAFLSGLPVTAEGTGSCTASIENIQKLTVSR